MLVQSQLWKHWNNVWYLFNVSNKETRTTLWSTLSKFLTFFSCVVCWLWTYKCWLTITLGLNIRTMIHRGEHLFLATIRYRSSHKGYSVRKSVLQNFAKFTGKYLCQSLFLNKVAVWGLCEFSCEVCRSFKKCFSYKTPLGDCFCRYLLDINLKCKCIKSWTSVFNEAKFRQILLPLSGEDTGRCISQNVASLSALVQDLINLKEQPREVCYQKSCS